MTARSMYVLIQECMVMSFFIAEGGGRACNFETGRISRVYYKIEQTFPQVKGGGIRAAGAAMAAPLFSSNMGHAL